MAPTQDDDRSSQPGSRGRFPRWAYVLLALMLLLPAAWPVTVFGMFCLAVRREARDGTCLSNEKQLAMGLLAYTMDYDGRLPQSGTWPTQARPYLKYAKGPEVFGCPNDRRPKPVAGIPWERGQGLSYAMSEALLSKGLPASAEATTTPLLFDCDLVPVATPAQAVPRHGSSRKGTNVAFVDGHVAWMGPDWIIRQQGGK